ncbi:5-(carboxyamino)imidazole ribonucleotide mutase [Microbulbifer sp. EKSA008]|uniref:5-(carboxyamino)imidazole ribonucleotide mutase n=1 Tax=unclassified Microbulbifer TaxID=2619833 RepID=UPI0024AE2877|nr:5-(carboxyamino)imidazole ribonucleotide mutase [Microbulbifer sp. VAAF005]WHI45567.1 5-(carboxyamino)imidazole ribonucleotide mutase [Microbulbifer sp. VAAF005]WNZ55702.1 5-(carboxyamino)imidazole ribonucleotide mutase [Microbulbifer sp. MKSA007]
MKPIPFEKVTIVMGSRSDWATMSNATKPLEELEVPFATAVVSAHRTPQRMVEFASRAHESGTEVIIAGAGGSAHLPGMIAALTPLPVIAVPVESRFMTGMDSLLSIVQMPRGVAVATQAVGASGAYNAGLMAAQMLSLADAELQKRLIAWRERQTEQVPITVE